MKKTILIYRKNNLLGSAGGVEKILSWFSNALVREGYQVHLTTRDKHEAPLFYPVDKRVHFAHFRIKHYRLKRILDQITFHLFKPLHREGFANKLLYDYCQTVKPDVAILAGIPDLVDFVYHHTYPCQKIVQIHCEPNYYFTGRPAQVRLYKKMLQKADMVQVLLPSFKKIVQQFYHGPIVVIGNCVVPNLCHKKKKEIIIYPARIEPHKQQLLLIRAFAKIATCFPKWQIHLYGAIQNKEYHQQCVNLIHQHHLEKQVLFLGNVPNIPEKLAEAAICAFPSKSEGFSLALTEAMAAQLPCIGFQKSPSVNEMIQPDFNGFLARDVDDFAHCLEKLMRDAKLRTRFGKNAEKYIQSFSPKAIIQQWKKVIEEK